MGVALYFLKNGLTLLISDESPCNHSYRRDRGGGFPDHRRKALGFGLDVQMVESGISRPYREKYGNSVFCHVGDADVAAEAGRTGETRSTLAMRKAKEVMEGAVVAVGNAPTALFEVNRLIVEEGVRPALVVGVPVGFVGARESKVILARQNAVPWIVTRGPKGGSTVAVAIVNALFRLV